MAVFMVKTFGLSFFAPTTPQCRRGSKIELKDRVKAIGRFPISSANVDRRTDAGDRVELLGEGHRKPDAPVRSWVSRVEPAVERDAVLVDALHPRHRRIVVLLRSVEWPLVEDREDPRRSGFLVLSGRNRRHRDEGVAAIEKGELIGEADHDPFRSRAVGDVAPEILARLQPLEAERLEHIEGGVRSGFARLHLRLEGFQRKCWSWKGGSRKYARSRQRKRSGQTLHVLHLTL